MRTESQNRADFLLKMMAKGGDYRTYRSRSPDVTMSPKMSPTGRKISMDIKPRSSTSFGASGVNSKLDHTYVNIPVPNSDKSSDTPSPSDITATSRM